MNQEVQTFVPYRFTLGHFDCLIVNDGPFFFPASFAAATTLTSELNQALREANMQVDRPIPFHQNILVINTGNERVLVDTGFGHAMPTTGQLLPQLQAGGIIPEDITTIILTHAHPDHLLGLLDAEDHFVFPQARYIMSRTEWNFWSTDPLLQELVTEETTREQFRAAPRAILPLLQEKIHLVDFGSEILPGITALEAAGHTPGHMALEIASGDERLLHMVDAVTHPILHFQHTDWFGPVDNWPAHTVPTRRHLLNRAVDEHLLVLAYHFEFPGLGYVVREGDDGWRWEPIPQQTSSNAGEVSV